MASIEFLEKRIAGKGKEIAKLEKKIERIEKAKASNWEVNPYYYNESDLKWAHRDLEEAKKALANYEADLVKAQEKANSRNVKVIIDFLENWKAKTRKFFIASVDRYIEAKASYYKMDGDLCKAYNTSRDREERNNLRKEMQIIKKEFKEGWGWIEPYMERNTINLERLDKDLKAEAERKYDFIIERTVAITGQITDASHLHIGDDGCELNGYIIGEKGEAKVQTIGAGGWNIQRFHFRTLIHKKK